VRLVIADTGPINYLILIGNIDLLPALFENVILPSAVEAELADPDALPSVRNWIAHPPAWLAVHETPSSGFDKASAELDEGETAAIALAISLDADLVLMDDRKAVKVARAKGLRVAGTLARSRCPTRPGQLCRGRHAPSTDNVSHPGSAARFADEKTYQARRRTW
jgi:predicted nucleic acid-binding protein